MFTFFLLGHCQPFQCHVIAFSAAAGKNDFFPDSRRLISDLSRAIPLHPAEHHPIRVDRKDCQTTLLKRVTLRNVLQAGRVLSPCCPDILF